MCYRNIKVINIRSAEASLDLKFNKWSLARRLSVSPRVSSSFLKLGLALGFFFHHPFLFPYDFPLSLAPSSLRPSFRFLAILSFQIFVTIRLPEPV